MSIAKEIKVDYITEYKDTCEMKRIESFETKNNNFIWIDSSNPDVGRWIFCDKHQFQILSKVVYLYQSYRDDTIPF